MSSNPNSFEGVRARLEDFTASAERRGSANHEEASSDADSFNPPIRITTLPANNRFHAMRPPTSPAWLKI